MTDERAITRKLNIIAVRYLLLWLVAIALYVASRVIGNLWITVAYTALLLLLIQKMIFPYIRLIYFLWRTYLGFRGPVRNNLILAILNLITAVYSTAGIWVGWPYISATLVFSFLVSVINSSFMGSEFDDSYNQIEQALLEQYASEMSITMGSSHSEARQMAEEMLKQAVEESKKEGSYHLPQTLGDIILRTAGTDHPVTKKLAEAIRRNVPRKKAEGVRDEDIRWWWNLNDIERRMMVKVDDMSRMALFTHECEIGKTDAEAAAKVRKFHPVYGDPGDTTHTTGDDRPLPYELKERVNLYIEKHVKSHPEKYKTEIEKTSTFNALVRKEIRAGNL